MIKITMNPTTYGLSPKTVESNELTIGMTVTEGNYVVSVEEDGEVVNEFPLTVKRDLTYTIALDPLPEDPDAPDIDAITLIIDGLDMSDASLIVGSDVFTNPVTKLGSSRPTDPWDIWIKE